MPVAMTSRRARWAVPAGVVAAVAAVTAGSMVTAAAAAPDLPAQTPAQLLAAVASHAGTPPPMSGTVVESADLGIPQLPGEQTQSSILSLLTGSHTIKLWYADPAHVRLALPIPLGETDLIRKGDTAWAWQSSSDSVTKITLPVGSGSVPGVPGAGGTASPAPLTPQQAAQQALAAAGPSTKVTVGPTTTVAGQDAYQLVIAPRDSRSLVGKVVIDLDAQHPGVALGVRLFARRAARPAAQTSFTSITFGAPPASTFDFTPPPGASVHTQAPGTPPGGNAVGTQPPQAATGVSLIGKKWLTVAVLPASALTALSQGGNPAAAVGQAAQSAASGPGGGGGSVSSAAVLAALLRSATPVHGAWGSGKLVRTSLISALITTNGHVLIGAVSPSVLYSAAGQVK
jgi:outer membrane lipoprotein-sorting protein